MSEVIFLFLLVDVYGIKTRSFSQYRRQNASSVEPPALLLVLSCALHIWVMSYRNSWHM